MKSLKEKALDKILLGVSLKIIIPASLGFLYPELFENSNYDENLVLALSFLILILFLVGYVIFIQGCFLYIESKGYSSKWGWLGVLSLLILPIFFFIPSKRDKISVQSDNSENASFEEVNIPEISLSIFIGIPLVIFVISLIFFSYKDLTESILIESFISIIVWIVYAIALLAKMKELRFDINQIFGFDNSINFKSILAITIMRFAFNTGLGSLMLYQLSFVFPKYVEYVINDKRYTNLL
ncbi:MAG: hypothetical protein F6K18_11085 [Okeania sp. SIO2C2]|uniref:hypothetical protein n=1 Tax=Okeania sp. SIO2C2 TaxID=2607787 RepID=UPI0013B5C978|nr:hypothetical protein [Okeania sp. SIO2C2]NEP87324.1 hypothetical protein [Okeania sp. SIO2C2]